MLFAQPSAIPAPRDAAMLPALPHKECPLPLARIVILGIGNILKGDDGVGVQVVEALHRLPLPPAVECIDGGTGGPTLMLHFEGAPALIVVDCVNLNEPPGTVRVLALAEIQDAQSPARFSLHEIGLMPILDLARQLGTLPPMVRIVAVQGHRFDLGDRLSPAVAAAVPRAVDVVLDEIRRLLDTTEPG